MIPEDLKEEAKNYGAAITKKKAKNQQIPVFFPRELMSKKWNIRREREMSSHVMWFKSASSSCIYFPLVKNNHVQINK